LGGSRILPRARRSVPKPRRLFGSSVSSRDSLEDGQLSRALSVATEQPNVATVAKSRSSFFLAMSAALLLIVLLGFAPTLYLRPFFDVPEHPVYLLLHGAVLTVWFVWFFTQNIWVAIGRRDIHRRLGVVGVGIAFAVVAAGAVATLGLIPRAVARRRDVEADFGRYAGIVWANLGLLIEFSIFVSAAVWFRHRPAIHKRLMLLASISIVGPAIARIARFPALQVFDSRSTNEIVFTLSGLLALLLLMVVHDVASGRRLHPVTAMGVPGVFAAVVFFGLVVPNTALGQTVVRLLTSGAH
jgi:hypothetical protein